jgi:PEGA domain
MVSFPVPTLQLFGIHTFKLSPPGFGTMRRIPLFVILVAILLAAGCTKEAPPTGSLNITSNPRHAEVFLDGTLRGRTPLILDNLSAGSHLLQLRLSGYAEWVEMVTVNAGQRMQISADYPSIPTPAPETPTTLPTYETTTAPTMKPTDLPETPVPPGALYISSFPQGATIYLDGKGYGVTPNLIRNLTPKSYELRLSLVGWKDYKIVLSVSPGLTTIEEATLRP